MNRVWAIAWVMILGGCSLAPKVYHQPMVYNPFPQLSKVAVAPFINLSTEPTLDGRQVALAYYDALQSVPGFEVVPIGVVEGAMNEYRINLESAGDARRLAQLLEVDAVVTGAVTDFSPYYPPRMALHVEWYAANPCLHPIPPGFGLADCPQEEGEIPERLRFEARFAEARSQLLTESPEYVPIPPPAVESVPPDDGAPPLLLPVPLGAPAYPHHEVEEDEELDDVHAAVHVQPATDGLTVQPVCRESHLPVLKHTRTYKGNDPSVAEALDTYVQFQDDERFGGAAGILQRSDDFIRFCCQMHVAELLTARGGAGKTRVAWRWPADR